MAVFLTVDRLGKLQDGQVLDIVRHTNVRPVELQDHVDALFPNGVSTHGERYFLKNDSLASVANPRIELLFEYVRRARFHDRPSRFMSYFGVETLECARTFNAKYCKGEATIWEVESDTWFRANMTLLTSDLTNLVLSYYAELYWAGAQGPATPFWEVLLAPPVRVLRKVEEVPCS